MYGVLPYYLTKTFVELPFQLFMPVIFTLIVFWAIHFRNTAESFFIYCNLITARDIVAGLVVIVFYGNSLGVWLGSMFSNIRAVFAIVPVFSMCPDSR